jgi:hypothetical protein
MTGALAKRREVMLGLLVVLLAAALWKNLGGLIGGVTGGGGGAPGRGSRPEIAGLKLYPIDWASLDAPRPNYDPNGRNIFQFGVIPPPPPPVLTKEEQEAIKKAQKAAEEERARQQAMLQQQIEAEARAKADKEERDRLAILNPPPPPPPPKPQPPPITYKFIGYFGPVNAKVAVLSDGQETLFVRQGEELPNGIKVLEIGYEAIKFGFTDPQFKNESRTLPMSSSY